MNASAVTGVHAAAAPQSTAPLTPAWNVLVTAQPAPRALHELLTALHRFGEFRATPFHDVCIGRVSDMSTFLDALLEAQAAGRPWTKHLARVVPVARTFEFAPDAFLGKLETAAEELAADVGAGTFMVRVERRGLPDAIHTQELERLVAEQLFRAAEAGGKTLQTSFDDPDYILAVETLGTGCGVALITRDCRRRYPFVRVR